MRLKAAHFAVRELVTPAVQDPRDLRRFVKAGELAQLHLLVHCQRATHVTLTNPNDTRHNLRVRRVRQMIAFAARPHDRADQPFEWDRTVP